MHNALSDFDKHIDIVEMNEKLKSLYNECVSTLKEIGVETAPISDLSLMDSSEGLAYTHISCDGRITVKLHYGLLLPGVPHEDAKSTMIHELLHAVNGCANHSDTWKALARYVEIQLGCTISEIASADKAKRVRDACDKLELVKKEKKEVCYGKRHCRNEAL